MCVLFCGCMEEKKTSRKTRLFFLILTHRIGLFFFCRGISANQGHLGPDYEPLSLDIGSTFIIILWLDCLVIQADSDIPSTDRLLTDTGWINLTLVYTWITDYDWLLAESQAAEHPWPVHLRHVRHVRSRHSPFLYPRWIPSSLSHSSVSVNHKQPPENNKWYASIRSTESCIHPSGPESTAQPSPHASESLKEWMNELKLN